MNGVNKLLNVSIKVMFFFSSVFFSIHAVGVRIKSAVHDANKRFTNRQSFLL